ncbi:MAG TPA: VOC family protein [Ramlibacter sp.]|uniref:VOC family protein n=1 Tax=Ramlibacter sp. TaxID=1917967 RepID=UPI002CC4B4EE|nr:VOC family protein [Ramlibacter sp.]HVZ45806.1 VOC family protein [Ramlibacter sp.]
MSPIRYRRLGYVAFEVTDLQRSIAFYRDVVGLQLETADEGAAFFRCSEAHHDFVLYAAAAPGLRRVAFQLESAEVLARAREYIAGLGWPVAAVPGNETAALHQGETFRFRLPVNNLQVEFYAEIEPGATPWIPSVAKIARIGHCVIASNQPEAIVRDLLDHLNFRVSDKFGEAVTFMRCFPNPYHHSFGVARAETDRFHHLNFMVVDIDDIGRATNRLKKNGVEIVFGPGRHDISDSIFLYFLDPDGMTVEYSFGMEEFDEHSPRAARLLPTKPEVLDSWGGLPTPRMGKQGRLVNEEPVKG